MSASARIVAALLCVVVGTHAAAQFRQGDAPVLRPPEAPPDRPPIDAAPGFAVAYARAGQPTVMLFWNRELSDRFATATEERTTLTEQASVHRNGLEKSSSGSAESATLREQDGSSRRQQTLVKGTYEATKEVGRAAPAIEQRQALMVERAFMAAMNRGGIRFVDRNLSVRVTAAERHRSGGDRQLVETDALLGKSDLVMEVLWIEDRDAPAGYGFDVRTRRLRDGREIGSLYTRAMPEAPPVKPDRWVAGPTGYALESAPRHRPSPVDVGNALARDVMASLTPRFEREETRPTGRRP